MHFIEFVDMNGITGSQPQLLTNTYMVSRPCVREGILMCLNIHEVTLKAKMSILCMPVDQYLHNIPFLSFQSATVTTTQLYVYLTRQSMS